MIGARMTAADRFAARLATPQQHLRR